MITLPVTPVPAPRQVRSDAWYPRPIVTRYNQFKDVIRLVHKVDIPLDTVHVDLVFELPMPKSWSKKRRAQMDGRYHGQRPDLDNLVKAFIDAAMFDLVTGKPQDDSFISSIAASKHWSEEGSIAYATRKEQPKWQAD